MAKLQSARRTLKPPSYRLHKGSGQARVRWRGQEIYLGKFGSPESQAAYSKLVAEIASGAFVTNATDSKPKSNPTVNEIVLGFLWHAQAYYVKNNRQTNEVACIKSAVRPLVNLYGDTPVSEFGPIALKSVRQKMIDAGWMRRYCNMSIGRIRRMFKWAVENELVDERILVRLQSVSPLLAGRTTAKEHSPRKPVPKATVNKVKKLVPKRTADMIDLWLLTGARPGELCKLTGNMLDRKTHKKDGVWIADLESHKMSHKGKRRVLVFGPKAQVILGKYMPEDPTERLFKVGRANVSQSIRLACLKLKVPIFTAHWLRHTAATRVREDYGLDAAQVTLGHSKADTTELYAGVNLQKAIEVARADG